MISHSTYILAISYNIKSNGTVHSPGHFHVDLSQASVAPEWLVVEIQTDPKTELSVFSSIDQLHQQPHGPVSHLAQR